MRFRRGIVLAVLLGLVSSSFIGCGKTSDSDSSSSTKVDTKSMEGKIEVTLPQGNYIDFVKKSIIPDFKKEYPKVDVTVSTDKDIDTRIAAGDSPDIYAGVFGYSTVKYAKLDKLVNYEKFSDYKDLKSRINERYGGKVLDGTYYVPWNATTTLMIYNKDLFKEAGLDPEKPPTTFDEFLDDAKKISALPNRKDGSKVYGTVFWNDVLTQGGWYWSMLAPLYYNVNGGKDQLLNKMGTDIVFDKPEAKLADFYSFLQKAQKYAPPTMEKNFFSRSIGMWPQFGYGWKANLKDAAGKPMEIGKDVGVAPIPVPKAGDTSYSTLDGRALMMFKSNSKKEKIAWEFVKFLMKDDKNLEACKELGQLPTLKSLENNEYFKQPENKPFVDQLQHAILNENFAEAENVASAVQLVYPQVVIENKLSPEDAVKQAAVKAREVLKNKN